jgi:hypothetical protein
MALFEVIDKLFEGLDAVDVVAAFTLADGKLLIKSITL